MQVSVVKIGNSKGIRIPKKVLDQCHVDDVLELTIKDNDILLTPVHKKPREGWAETIQALLSKHGEEAPYDEWLDAKLIDEALTDEELTEW